jgi:hypothetical protein
MTTDATPFGRMLPFRLSAVMARGIMPKLAVYRYINLERKA